MSAQLDTRRIVIFLLFAFGIAWATALVIYLTGGLIGSPNLIEGMPGANLPLAVVLMAFPMMWAPAIAHILTRLITREGWKNNGLRPNLSRRTWIYWLIAWLGFPLLFAIGAAVAFMLLPANFDPTMDTTIQAQMAAAANAGQSVSEDFLRSLVWIQIPLGLVTAPLINSFFTFGEEYGWRGYLQQKLTPLGGRAAMLLMGVIWGVWHWPVLLMGYNYGLDYPGAPWAGPLAFVWFTFLAGTILGWLTLKSRSVWPAVLGHAMINGFAGLGSVFLRGEPNLVLGPLPQGVLGSIPLVLVVAWILLSPNALTPAEDLGKAELGEEPSDLVTKPA